MHFSSECSFLENDDWQLYGRPLPRTDFETTHKHNCTAREAAETYLWGLARGDRAFPRSAHHSFEWRGNRVDGKRRILTVSRLQYWGAAQLCEVQTAPPRKWLWYTSRCLPRMQDWLIQAVDRMGRLFTSLFRVTDILFFSRAREACQTEKVVPDKRWGHRGQPMNLCAAQVAWNVCKIGQGGATSWWKYRSPFGDLWWIMR